MQRRTGFGLWQIILASGMLGLLVPACWAQRAKPGVARPARNAVAPASAVDGLELADKVKTVESPATRAYLYLQIATRLATSGKDEPTTWQATLNVATTGISEIHEHEEQIPPAAAFSLYERFLSLLGRYDSVEAARLREKYPLKLNANLTEDAIASRSLSSVIARLSGSPTSQNTAQAVQIISSGKVPYMDLLGALLRMDMSHSPALPQLLAATVALEERTPGSLPLVSMVFLSQSYLKDDTQPEVQVRFLAAAVNATQLNLPETMRDPTTRSWAVTLLRQTLPAMQKLTPDLYSTAASQLAALGQGQPRESLVYDRIKNSSDPLAQTMLEADQTVDQRLKRQLLESAAQLAKRQGKLRLAADLITGMEEDRRGLPEEYSSDDQFLDSVVQTALKEKDPDTARYALSKMRLHVSRAEALRKVSSYLLKVKDGLSAREALNEAARTLTEAPDGREKAITFLKVTTDFTDVDLTQASEVARAAVKAADNIRRPQEDSDGQFSWSIFPIMDSTMNAFQALALKDRAVALALADIYQSRDFKLAARLGIYNAFVQQGNPVSVRM